MKAYKRIILKLSGDFFRNGDGPVDPRKAHTIAEEIARVRERVELGVIFGAGNIWRGRNNFDRLLDETASHYMGIMGTFVNALALEGALKQLGITSHVLAPFLVPHVAAEIDSFDVDEVLERKEILIFAGGTGRPGVTNDTAAVERALDIGADAVFKGTRVDGVYDQDPERFPDAHKFDTIGYDEYLKRGLGVMDQEAIAVAREKSVPVTVFRWEGSVFASVLDGSASSTTIS